MMRNAGAKLIFADQLRGVAALMVVMNHLLGVFWVARDFIGAITFSAPLPPTPLPLDLRVIASPWHNLGPLGVALFYLISGFVIPFSFRHHTRLSFLGARILRIFPVYLLCFGLDLVILMASSAYWHKPFTLTQEDIVDNLFLVHNLASIPPIDTVNVTLATEVKFYILCCLMFSLIRAGKSWPIYIFSFLLYGLYALFRWDTDIPPVYGHVISEGDFFSLIFMMIGVLFHYHHAGKLTLAPLAAGSAVLMGLFVACWQIARPEILPAAVDYGYALVLFGLAYGLRGWFRPIRLLNGLAAISYPLYLLHPILGYSLMKLLLMKAGLSPWSAFLLTMTVVGVVAWLVHVGLERPSIAWGRWLSRREPASPPPLAKAAE
jgi:peptidoglycan/LPS O-acetylase OafA/YrhL